MCITSGCPSAPVFNIFGPLRSEPTRDLSRFMPFRLSLDQNLFEGTFESVVSGGLLDNMPSHWPSYILWTSFIVVVCLRTQVQATWCDEGQNNVWICQPCTVFNGDLSLSVGNITFKELTYDGAIVRRTSWTINGEVRGPISTRTTFSRILTFDSDTRGFTAQPSDSCILALLDFRVGRGRRMPSAPAEIRHCLVRIHRLRLCTSCMDVADQQVQLLGLLRFGRAQRHRCVGRKHGRLASNFVHESTLDL